MPCHPGGGSVPISSARSMNYPLRVPLPSSTLAPARRRDAPRRLRLLARNRYQLLGAVLWAVCVPFAVRTDFPVMHAAPGSAEYTAMASFAAVLVGAYVLRKMTAFPGTHRSFYVLPTFAVVYGVLFALFLFLRLDYSRFLMLAGFVMSVAWFYFALHFETPARRPYLLVVPGGDAGNLAENEQADWHVARTLDGIPSGVTGVVADLRADHDAAAGRFLAGCALAGLPVYHSKQVRESFTGRVEIEHLSENSLGSLVPSSVYMRFKRGIDIAAALVALPLAAPLALAAAVLIKLDDGGPVLFRQSRMGFRGRIFTILKFRTMRADEGGGRPFTGKDDPRITRAGRFLRRYRIDELPQMVNILRGEMSWIGPRPESLALSQWYESRIPFYSYRHIVRPGITGWAQVNQGNVAEIEAATAKLQYDFYYIKYFSPWIELMIAARTVWIVLTGFGSR